MPNDSHNGAQKSALRTTLLALRRRLTPSERNALSAATCQQVLAHDCWRAARTVVAYAATPDEVDATPLLRAALAGGKTLVLPRIADKQIAWRVVDDLDAQLAPGAFGIPEPPDAARQWDPAHAEPPVLWLVPGVGFDRKGRRLGRGGGYYDRALRAADARHGTVGLAFPCQLADAIPVSDGDWPVEFVATASGWIAAVTQIK